MLHVKADSCRRTVPEFLLFFLMSTHLYASHTGSAAQTADVIDAIVTRLNQIEAIRVSYTLRFEQPSFLEPTSAYLHCCSVAVYPDLFITKIAHGHSNLPWNLDPYQIWTLTEHGRILQFRPSDRSYSIVPVEPGKRVSDAVQPDPYL